MPEKPEMVQTRTRSSTYPHTVPGASDVHQVDSGIMFDIDTSAMFQAFGNKAKKKIKQKIKMVFAVLPESHRSLILHWVLLCISNYDAKHNGADCFYVMHQLAQNLSQKLMLASMMLRVQVSSKNSLKVQFNCKQALGYYEILSMDLNNLANVDSHIRSISLADSSSSDSFSSSPECVWAHSARSIEAPGTSPTLP